nr:MAG TPA: hypothetical protein [Bacteriophage sp.]
MLKIQDQIFTSFKIILTIYIHLYTFTINNPINSYAYIKIHFHGSNFNFTLLP